MRAVIVIAAQHKWKVFQMDAKFAFLNGVLKEEVYVEQPPSYVVPSQESKVYRMKAALYGLKQAPQAWYNRINSYLLSNGFSKSDGKPTVYIKVVDGKNLIVVLYVDDLVSNGDDAFLIADFKGDMKREFEMIDLGLLRYFLGIEIKQMYDEIFLSRKVCSRDFKEI